jgi:hypothetical protein
MRRSVARRVSSTCNQNTNERPAASASVTYAVARTKAANCAFVTVVAAIENGLRRTSRLGPSPSCA